MLCYAKKKGNYVSIMIMCTYMINISIFIFMSNVQKEGHVFFQYLKLYVKFNDGGVGEAPRSSISLLPN